MKLTATVKLHPTEDQRQLLYQTLEQTNAACNLISEHAWKAQQFGRTVVHRLVDPRNTSRTCPTRGCIDKANRPTQARFSCIQCGHAAPADYVAAINIARRAVVKPPYCSDANKSAAPEQSPHL